MLERPTEAIVGVGIARTQLDVALIGVDRFGRTIAHAQRERQVIERQRVGGVLVERGAKDLDRFILAVDLQQKLAQRRARSHVLRIGGDRLLVLGDGLIEAATFAQRLRLREWAASRGGGHSRLGGGRLGLERCRRRGRRRGRGPQLGEDAARVFDPALGGGLFFNRHVVLERLDRARAIAGLAQAEPEPVVSLFLEWPV